MTNEEKKKKRRAFKKEIKSIQYLQKIKTIKSICDNYYIKSISEIKKKFSGDHNIIVTMTKVGLIGKDNDRYIWKSTVLPNKIMAYELFKKLSNIYKESRKNKVKVQSKFKDVNGNTAISAKENTDEKYSGIYDITDISHVDSNLKEKRLSDIHDIEALQELKEKESSKYSTNNIETVEDLLKEFVYEQDQIEIDNQRELEEMQDNNVEEKDNPTININIFWGLFKFYFTRNGLL